MNYASVSRPETFTSVNKNGGWVSPDDVQRLQGVKGTRAAVQTLNPSLSSTLQNVTPSPTVMPPATKTTQSLKRAASFDRTAPLFVKAAQSWFGEPLIANQSTLSIEEMEDEAETATPTLIPFPTIELQILTETATPELHVLERKPGSEPLPKGNTPFISKLIFFCPLTLLAALWIFLALWFVLIHWLDRD